MAEKCRGAFGRGVYCKNTINSVSQEWEKEGFCSPECANHGSDTYKQGYFYCQRCKKKTPYANKGNASRAWDYFICATCEPIIKQESARRDEEHKKNYRSIKCGWCGKTYCWINSNAINKDKYCCPKCEAHK